MTQAERGRRGWLVLWALLFAVVAWQAEMPAAGAQCIVRAAAVQAQNGYTVGLLYQQPAEAADASQAQEQMRLAWGEGATLGEAYGAAEQLLPGQPVYKLCDSVLLCGSRPAETLQAQRLQVENGGRGRLSARVLVWQGNAAALAGAAEEEQTALADALETLQQDAPRLYQARSGTLLAPVLAWREETFVQEGLLYLGEQPLLLTDQAAQAALLLRDGRARLEYVLPDGSRARLRAWGSAVPDGPGAARLQVWAMVSGAADTAENRGLLTSWLEQLCLSVWEKTGEQAADLPGTQTLLALRYGGAPRPAERRSCQVRLWLLGR